VSALTSHLQPIARLVLHDSASHSGQTGEREVLLVLFGGPCTVAKEHARCQ
jgi:hypothetical protein